MAANDPAFPVVTTCDSEAVSPGLTKREWFAGMALQGLMASAAFHGPIYQQQPEAAAQFAYRVADALLSASGENGYV